MQDSASWREQKGPVSQRAVFQSGEDTDRELDCMLDLPAPRKPMNSPEEVHELSLLCLLTALWKSEETKYPISGSRVLELVLREGGAVTSAFQVRIWDIFPEGHGVEI